MSAPASLDWDWAKATGGTLSARQRRQLMTPLLRTFVGYGATRLRLALGRRGDGGFDLDRLRWPDSKLAREAEQETRESLSPHVREHSVRTYLFGRALAMIDAAQVDEELVYVASLLHDLQLEHPTPRRCFAVVGGERAERFALDRGASPERAAEIGGAIAGHITPGASENLADAAGFVSAGALVDVAGTRLDELDREWVDRVLGAHPRRAMKQPFVSAWKEEGRAVPDGRARWLTLYAGFPLLVHTAPFPDW